MSLKSVKRAEWIQRRVDQACEAAEGGDGWVALGNLWGTTNSSALMWCRYHLPLDVFRKIGQNGLRAKCAERGRRAYENGKPKLVSPLRTKPEPNYTCLKLTYRAGVVIACGEPSYGHARCPKCAASLVTMFDPKRKQPPSAEAA
jgi:hypothetical protein